MQNLIGIGTDLVEIARIKQSLEKFGENFLQKIFSEEEILYCKSKNNFFETLAGKFAGKEAVFKAFKTSRKNLEWKSIKILNKEDGSPFVILPQNFDSFQVEISISHTKDFAQAFCVVMKISV
ncbi:holo-ACP synthase [bacterium]|nr:holo-ACP synthase [bacterium]